MRIAVPFDKADGTIAPAFAQAASFRLYNIEGGKIVSDLTIPAFGTGGHAMLELLRAAKADVLICGGVTRQERQLVAAAGIMVSPGFGGSADDAAFGVVGVFEEGKHFQRRGRSPRPTMIYPNRSAEDVVGVGDDGAVAVGLGDEPAVDGIIGILDVEVAVAIGHAGEAAEGVVGVALNPLDPRDIGKVMSREGA